MVLHDYPSFLKANTFSSFYPFIPMYHRSFILFSWIALETVKSSNNTLDCWFRQQLSLQTNLLSSEWRAKLYIYIHILRLLTSIILTKELCFWGRKKEESLDRSAQIRVIKDFIRALAGHILSNSWLWSHIAISEKMISIHYSSYLFIYCL